MTTPAVGNWAERYPRGVRDVNAMLRARGVDDVRLTRGKGYFYFRGVGFGPGVDGWPATAVYTYNADSRSLAEWWNEFERLRADRGRPWPTGKRLAISDEKKQKKTLDDGGENGV